MEAELIWVYMPVDRAPMEFTDFNGNVQSGLYSVGRRGRVTVQYRGRRKSMSAGYCSPGGLACMLLRELAVRVERGR